MKNTALRTAGTIFLVISLVHLFRAILGVSLSIHGHEVPTFISVIVFVVLLQFSIWMFRAANQ